MIQQAEFFFEEKKKEKKKPQPNKKIPLSHLPSAVQVILAEQLSVPGCCPV